MINVNANDKKIEKSLKDFVKFKFPHNISEEIFLSIEVFDNKGSILIKWGSFEKNISFSFKDFSECNHFLKREILKNLPNEFIDKSFGTLIGVRPSKLYAKIRDKNSREISKKILKRDYLMPENDIDFLEEIYVNQKNLLDASSYKNYNIYIHIPFCPSRCTYCSFPSLTIDFEKVPGFIRALEKELREISKYYKKPPHTVYIGGGTPSAIGSENLAYIIDLVLENYGRPEEFTVECGRADTFSLELLKTLNDRGISRISLNPQTFNEEILKDLNRYGGADFLKYYNMAKSLDFRVINMDLIIGLPGENKKSIISSINRVVDLDPENITLHSLALKKGSRLFESAYINDKDYSEILSYAKNLLAENSYKVYYMYRQKRMTLNGENIGYGKDKTFCLYNILIMEEMEDILAFGMAASTKILNKNFKFKKCFNYKNLADYENRINDIILEKSKLIEKKEELF
ncbi:coproporphyrinogen dehydrogenase HemZ [Peptoniphilus raoultii]|uniref:coproporphyrinogen dehydrogenase HemZ n=1 Tax=Peptoniphilus raoultii TaxID=1776387 RepID=UPI0008DA39AC|nr:coproporphyrinogen dehydrogenase HemZ [Peptoniphilus raoultii]